MAWLRILGAFAALILAVLLLRQLPALVVLAVVGGATWYGTRLIRRDHRAAQRTGVELLGLERETSDRFGIAGYPLQLFTRSEGATVDEVAWGPWRGLDVRVFSGGVRAPAVLETAGEGRTPVAGVLTSLTSEVPSLVIEPQAFATMFERPPALARVETFDDAFDATWSVWSRDEAFARSILADGVRSWLVSLGDAWGVELSARIAMVYGRRPERADVVAVLEILAGFLRRVPDDRLRAGPAPV